MESKKLLRIFRIVYYVIKNGIISRRKLIPDLRLLKRSKIACKAIANILSINNNHDADKATASFYSPHEVEFSCTNTPSHLMNKQKNHNCHQESYDYASVDAVAKAFEMLNLNDEASDAEYSVASSPAWGFLKSTPVVVRKLRVTDSPFPIKEDEVGDGEVDRQADEFIKRFYQQLRKQPRVPMTPMHEFHRR